MNAMNIENYYNNFSSRFIKDYIYGNKRIQRQMEFFKNAIRKNVENVLVIGCGSGQTALYIAKHCAKKANISAVDISSEALNFGSHIFKHERVKYQQLNILTDSIGEEWDVIVLPDVYEHIPLESRKLFNSKISELLRGQWQILVTVPSPYHQTFLHQEHPEKLQVVDETIELRNLTDFAEDVSGVLSYFNIISVWNTNDYIHAIIEKPIHHICTLKNENTISIKRAHQCGIITKGWSYFSRKIRLVKVAQWFRRIRVMYAMKNK